MSVPAYTGPDSSVANGVTTTFPYSFKILSEDDLLVTVNGLVRQLGVHYTVTGVGNESGGNAVFVSPPVANAVVERSRNMPYARETEFQNLGDLLADTLNQDQDAPVMMIQQLASKVMQIIIDPGGSGQMVWDAKGRASFAVTGNVTLGGDMHNTLILANSAAPITITIRANTGGAADWKEGQFFSVQQVGTGQVSLVLEGPGTLTPPESFEAKSRAIGCIFSATCTAPDADAWTAAGDLMRGASNPDLQCMVLPDRSALIGTNIATGTGKDRCLSEAQPSGTPLTVDVKRNGTSILNVKLTFDNGERSTLTAALPPTLVPGGDILAAGDEITFDVQQVGTAGAKGLQVYLRLPPLFVTGNLPKAPPMVAYEGRLEIHNGIGGCTVRQIDGDRLPPGHRLYVDQAAKQVVLAWPAYQAGAAPIINPGFESGPTGWDTGAGWVIATENPPTGSWAAGYNNQQGESVISNTARYECFPGQRTTAKCKYRNAEGVVVLPVEGNRVMSASKNRVYDSNVVGTAPAGAATVNIAGNGIRFRENKILFVDDFEWDHTVAAVGLDHEAVFRITLQVSDSAGRSAIWSGVIGDRSTYFTSRPYGITAPIEGLLAATPVLAGSRMFVGSYADGERLAGAVPVFLAGTLRTPCTR
ncbi:hypothetical protein SNK04_014219 [Fusarium graminearum]